MRLDLRGRIFLVSLCFLLTSLVALYVMHSFIIRDFNDYTEGAVEDAVYRLTTTLEGQFERDHAFNVKTADDAVLAGLLMGFEMRVKDSRDRFVTDTAAALSRALPLKKRRLSAMIRAYEEARTKKDVPFVTYPLFLKSTEIGELSLRHFGEPKGGLFLRRMGSFFIIGIVVAVAGAAVLTFFLASTILAPVRRLHHAAQALSDGGSRIALDETRPDELGDLARSFSAMAASLEQKEHARSSSMARFAHELRTPLAVMQAELEGMADGVIPINRDRIVSMQEESARLRAMVEGLERLYRAERAAQQVEARTVDLGEFFHRIAGRFGALAGEKGVPITVDADGVTLSTDPDRLTQILMNLVDNAVEATSSGEVRLSARRIDSGAVIEVRDTGRGIDTGQLPFIFERFYTAGGKGFGIGLAIVKELTAALNGSVAVSSTAGAGTVFTVRLPDL